MYLMSIVRHFVKKEKSFKASFKTWQRKRMGRGERYKVNIRKEQRFHLEKMHESSTHTEQ